MQIPIQIATLFIVFTPSKTNKFPHIGYKNKKSIFAKIKIKCSGY